MKVALAVLVLIAASFALAAIVGTLTVDLYEMLARMGWGWDG